MQIYEAIAIDDIQAAADVLRPVFDASGGDDGYVSLEVSPLLADDTQGTIDEALRLESMSFHNLGQTGDLDEGTRAFREKRPAKFWGE